MESTWENEVPQGLTLTPTVYLVSSLGGKEATTFYKRLAHALLTHGNIHTRLPWLGFTAD